MKSPDTLPASSFGIAGRILTSCRHLLELIDRILAISESRVEDLGFLDHIPAPAGAS
jgi:hypothetical protein